MGSTCSCFTPSVQQDNKELKTNQPKPSLYKGDIDSIFSKFKHIMIPQIRELYERSLNGEQIRSIKINQKPLKTQGAQLLSNLFSFTPKVDELVLKGNQLGQEGAYALSQEIHNLRRLRKLKVNSNLIGDQGFLALTKALNAKNLEQLIFIDNQIGCEGIAELADILPSMKKLQYFYLPLNKISPRGIMKLVQGVENLPSLQEFIVDIESLSEQQLEEIQYRLPSVTLSHDNQMVQVLF